MSKFAFLSAVYLAATAVSGQLQELRRSTTTSPQTMAASHAAALNCPSDETMGIASCPLDEGVRLLFHPCA